MWKTSNNALVRILQEAKEFAKQDITGMDLWQKFVLISPSGVWNLYKAGTVGAPDPDQPLHHRKRASKGAGNASLNHIAAYLRKFVPHFVAMQYLPGHFVQNAESIPKEKVHERDPRIPSPDEMDLLAKEWARLDRKSAELLQFLRFSGSRIAAALDKMRGLRRPRVDLDNRDYILHQKGDERLRDAEAQRDSLLVQVAIANEQAVAAHAAADQNAAKVAEVLEHRDKLRTEHAEEISRLRGELAAAQNRASEMDRALVRSEALREAMTRPKAKTKAQ